MATEPQCYDRLCNIRTQINTELVKLGYDVSGTGCATKSITELMNIYCGYTGHALQTDDLVQFKIDNPPCEDICGVLVEDTTDGIISTCIEISGDYIWQDLGEASVLTSHTFTTDGTYNASDYNADGFSTVIINTASQRSLQNKTVTPSTTSQSVTADAGFIGLNSVVVTAIQASNVNVAATTVQQVITPTTGTFYNSVTVAPIMTQSKIVVPTSLAQIITPDAGYDGLASVTVQGDVNLVPENIIQGATIFGTIGIATASSANGKPIEIATEADMDLRRSNASASTAGTVYKYTGTTTGRYIQNTLYVIATTAPYTMRRVEMMYMKLESAMLTLTNNVLSWVAVPFANNYTIYKNGTFLAETQSTSYTLNIQEAGIYDITVYVSAAGYARSDSSHITYSVGTVSVIKYSTVNFPISNRSNIATEFNNKAYFSCVSTDGTYGTLAIYDSTFISTVSAAAAIFDTVTATNTHCFFSSNSNVYAYDTNGVCTALGAISTTNNFSKAATSLGGYAIFVVDASEGVRAIDDNLVVTTHNIGAYGFSNYRDVCAASTEDYAIIIPGHADEPFDTGVTEYDETYETSDTYTLQSEKGMLYVNSDLVCTKQQDANIQGYSCVAATSLGPGAIFVGGRTRTLIQYIKWGVTTPTVVKQDVRDINATNRALYIDNNLTSSLLSSLSEATHSMAAATIGNVAIFGGGNKSYIFAGLPYYDGSALAKVTAYTLDRIKIASPDLVTARGSIGAATIGTYAMFGGGGTASSSFADVYTLQAV